MARHLFPEASPETGPKLSPLESQSSKPIRVVDLGSGAGFPALPIKIWAPHIHLTMIESNQKKVTFLREISRVLKLTNVDVIPERAESVAARLPATSEVGKTGAKNTFQPADVVTFRAVEKFNRILPLATKFLAPNARLALLITTTQLEQLQSIQSIAWGTKHIPKSHTGILATGGII